MQRTHRFETTTVWSSARGTTASYTAYSRDHELRAEGRPPIPGSADPVFRGAPDRWNPELLLVGALSECHLLWYLHLCADNGIRIVDYVDEAYGVMQKTPQGVRFTEVVLRPRVRIQPGDDDGLATELHARAHAECFIANSVNFPVRHEPAVSFAEPAG